MANAARYVPTGGVDELGLGEEVSWVFCDRCGCSVDTDLIHPDGYHYADDGDFYCADCWELLS
jgi:hypothetical protein